MTELAPPLAAALTFAAAFAIAAGTTPLARWAGLRLGLIDRPGGRRQHTGVVTRIGGLGLFAGFFFTALGLYLLNPAAQYARPLLAVLAGTVFAAGAGLIDDRFQLGSGPQFLAQFVAAVIAIAGTVFIERVTLPLVGVPTTFPPWITYPLTVLWIMGMMNTVNWLDGLDGLAAGVGAIAAVLFAVHLFTVWHDPTIYRLGLYPLALAGACLGFLLFNFFPARVFLGSAGAMTLGYALATLSILAPARVATALLVMAVPIADAAYQVFDRWRHGRSPTQGDRGHLHFRLSDMGLSQRQIVLGYWLFCAVFGTLALVMPAGVYKLLALGVLGLIVVVVLARLSKIGRAGKEGTPE